MDEMPQGIPFLVPVFPLPEVVLFPRAVLPLHVFEPRYREMASDVLAGEHTIAVALLKPGFEPQYYTLRAPIHSVIGMGQVVASEQLDDGNYNILLRGVGRARILKELPHKPYRLARVQAIESPPEASQGRLDKLRADLRRTIEVEFANDSEIQQHWLRLFESALELGDLTDLIASGLSIDSELQQGLLVEPDPTLRAAILNEHIRTVAAVIRTRRTQSPQAEWKMN